MNGFKITVSQPHDKKLKFIYAKSICGTDGPDVEKFYIIYSMCCPKIKLPAGEAIACYP